MRRIIVLGASAASIGFLSRLNQLVQGDSITILKGQDESPYNKCLLADFLAYEKNEKEIGLSISHLNKNENEIQWIDQSAIGLDIIQKKVWSKDHSWNYDILFIGTGSSARVPENIQALNSDKIFTFHTLSQAQKILQYIKKNSSKKAIIVGAGLSGLECADALMKNNIQIQLFEKAGRILPSFLDEQMSAFLMKKIPENIEIFCNETITAVFEDQKRVFIETQDKKQFCADFLIFAMGQKQNLDFLANTPLIINENGIVVDETLRTNIDHIYAGGDTIQVTNLLIGKPQASCSWPDAMLQGLHAAYAVAGMPKIYKGAHIIVNSAFFGLNFAQAGFLQPSVEDNCILENTESAYHKYIMRNEKMIGFCVLGKKHDFTQLRRAIIS